MVNSGMYRKNRKDKKKKKRFFTFIAILVFVATGIVIAQVVINNKNNKNDKTLKVEAKSDTKQEATKEGDKQTDVEVKEKKEEKVVASNTSKSGQAFQDDGSLVQEISSWRGPKDGKKVAYLTFDDGPSTTVTPKILEVLKANDVKATFFMLGNEFEKGTKVKELLKEQYNDGHAIAIHSYSHNYKHLYPNDIISKENVMEEFNKTLEIMKGVLGQEFNTNVFRFPGGMNSWNMSKPKAGRYAEIEATLKEKGISHIEWNALSRDAEGKKNKSAAELLTEVKKTVAGQEKVVILMHDTYGKEQTAEALPQVIKYLKDAGYEFRTIK